MSGSDSQRDALAIAIHKWSAVLVWLERILASSVLVVIFGTMVSHVFARYVLRNPFGWSEELSRFGLIWSSLLAASFVMAEGNHIAVDLWSSRCSTKTSQRLTLLSHIVVSGCCLVLLLGGLRFVYHVHPVGSPALGIPKSLWYAAVSVSLLLMLIHSLANLLYMLKTGQPLIIRAVSIDAESHTAEAGGEDRRTVRAPSQESQVQS